MTPQGQLLSEEEALQKIFARLNSPLAVAVPLENAAGRVAVKDYYATLPLPAFDNSAMDGFAVRSAECAPGCFLRVIGEQAAGERDRNLRVIPGSAVRIFTGAPLPDGADAVVMQEDVEIRDDGIILSEEVGPGENVRTKGNDLCTGQKFIAAGTQISPPAVGLLASQGIRQVDAGKIPEVAVLTTGDELAIPGASLREGEIYDSNGPMISALLAQMGIQPRISLHAKDDLGEVRDALSAGLKSDVLIVCGGVSVGDRDLVKPVLNELGAVTEFWRIAVKPGKPFLFATTGRSVVFGLPGNPVSTFVTFQLFVRPALLRMMGAADVTPDWSECRLTESVVNDGERTFYVRGVIRGNEFAPGLGQGSHTIAALAAANAMARIPARSRLEKGTPVYAWRW